MNKIALSVLLSAALYAGVDHVEKNGKTYEIKERNLIELFQEHFKKNEKKINAKIAGLQKEMKQKIVNYKPKDLTKELQKAKKDNVFFVDPTYTVKENIYDSEGLVMYPKGYRFNPLHYVSMVEKYVVFDYTKKEEVEWIKKKEIHRDISVRLLISNGNVFDAMRDFGREVYFVNDAIIDKFELKSTPSEIEQVGDRLRVTETYIKKQ